MSKPFYLDDEECISCGTCADICPDCFRFESSMAHAEVISLNCPEDQIQEAMDSCPAVCIHWGESE